MILFNSLYQKDINYFIKINNLVYSLDKMDFHISLIQYLDKNNVIIPRFCYHEALSIAGNCRMCLVELVGATKLAVACATPITDGLEILTNSLLVKKSREYIIEFLLINHPLDCPICDQGGECDLQDQTLFFGSDSSRFEEVKRSVSDKNFGPFIKTIMTRCIHCTRCIRYMEDIAEEPIIGIFGRGKLSEISIYDNEYIKSNISGNLIDVCPVGALTSKLYAFRGRLWELDNVYTIDILDSMNSNIQIHIKNNIIYRILPKINVEINNFWITDYIRFVYDTFSLNRILSPLIKNKSVFLELNWNIALELFIDFFNTEKKKLVVFGKLESLETSFYFNYLSKIIKYNLIMEEYVDNNHSTYINTYITEFLDENSIYILNNLNISKNLPLLWIKLSNLDLIQIGTFFKDYKYHIGLSQAVYLLLIYGKSLHSTIVFNYLNQRVLKKKGLNTLTTLNEYNVSYNSGEDSYAYFNLQDDIMKKNYNIVLLIETNKYFKKLLSPEFVIYVGSYLNEDARSSDLILPTLNFTEDSLLYLNLLGFFQKTNKCIYQADTVKSKLYLILQLNSYILLSINEDLNYLINNLEGKIINTNISLNITNTNMNYIYVFSMKETDNLYIKNSSNYMYTYRSKLNINIF
jgi:NADH dehydrogenase/NADH:ubiquinone oxidoreductase subunit G